MADQSNGAGDDGIDPSAVASLLRSRTTNHGLVVRVEGSSMGRAIPGGGEVRVVVSSRPRRGEIWCYVDDIGRPVVHRVRAIRGESVVLRGDGNRSNDVPVQVDRLVGRVVQSTAGRGFGTIDRWRSVIGQVGTGVIRRLNRLRRPPE